MENMQAENPNMVLNDLSTRIRILEGKYNLTRERIMSINQNMIDHYKSFKIDTKMMNEDIQEIKESLENLKKTMRDLVKELKFFARKDKLKIIEKYINLWNPLNFVTEEEVLKLIEKNKVKNGKTNKK
jgi:hypothetical protein